MAGKDVGTIINLPCPHRLKTDRCTPSTSYFQQIQLSAQLRGEVLLKQQNQFNLGNQQTFSDPFQAADYLLQREYGDTYLYGKNPGHAVFIPPFFICAKENRFYFDDVSILTNNVKEEIKKASVNTSRYQPGHWFTLQVTKLYEFIETNTDQLNKSRLDDWVCKMKLLHLLYEYGPAEFDVNMEIQGYYSPNLMVCDFTEFYDHCLKVLLNLFNNGHQHNIKKELEMIKKNLSKNKTSKIISKKEFQRILKDKPLTHSVLQFLSNVELSYLTGEQTERWLFEKLREIITGDFTVLHSCDFYTELEKSKHHQEIDFLIFSAAHKIIIAIEAKASATKGLKEFSQLRKYKDIFEESFGDQLDEEWHFIPVLFVYNPESVSEHESKYIITRHTNLRDWFESILKDYPIETQYDLCLSQLKNVLKLSVFILHISRACLPNRKTYGPFVRSNISQFVTDVIETISKASNIIFYSNEQLQILGSNYEKLWIDGHYSTGKTILLREKAEQMAKSGEKVLFLFANYWQGGRISLLQRSLEEKWKEPKFNGNIICKSIMDKITTIQELVKHKAIKHIFIDEMHGLYNEDLKFFAHHATTLWMAVPHFRYHPVHYTLKEIPKVTLWTVLRSTRSIANFQGSKSNLKDQDFKYDEPPTADVPENIPEGNQPIIIEDENLKLEDLLRIAYVRMCMTKSRDQGIIFLLRGYYGKNLKRVITQISSLTESDGKHLSFFLVAAPESVEMTEDPLRVISDGNGVLVTEPYLMEGFEWPNLIVCFRNNFNTATNFGSDTNTSCYTRCTTTLIVVDQSNISQ